MEEGKEREIDTREATEAYASAPASMVKAERAAVSAAVAETPVEQPQETATVDEAETGAENLPEQPQEEDENLAPQAPQEPTIEETVARQRAEENAKEIQRAENMTQGVLHLRNYVNALPEDFDFDDISDGEAAHVLAMFAMSRGETAQVRNRAWLEYATGESTAHDAAVAVLKVWKESATQHRQSASIILSPTFGDADKEEKRIAETNFVLHGNDESQYRSWYSEAEYKAAASLESQRVADISAIWSGASSEQIRAASTIALDNLDADEIATRLSGFSPVAQRDITAMAGAMRAYTNTRWYEVWRPLDEVRRGLTSFFAAWGSVIDAFDENALSRACYLGGLAYARQRGAKEGEELAFLEGISEAECEAFSGVDKNSFLREFKKGDAFDREAKARLNAQELAEVNYARQNFFESGSLAAANSIGAMLPSILLTIAAGATGGAGSGGAAASWAATAAAWGLRSASFISLMGQGAGEYLDTARREDWNVSKDELLGAATLYGSWFAVLNSGKLSAALGKGRKFLTAAVGGRTAAQRLASAEATSAMKRLSREFFSRGKEKLIEGIGEGFEEGGEAVGKGLIAMLGGTKDVNGDVVYDWGRIKAETWDSMVEGWKVAPFMILPLAGVGDVAAVSRKSFVGLDGKPRSLLTAEQELINIQARAESIEQAKKAGALDKQINEFLALDEKGRAEYLSKIGDRSVVKALNRVAEYDALTKEDARRLGTEDERADDNDIADELDAQERAVDAEETRVPHSNEAADEPLSGTGAASEWTFSESEIDAASNPDNYDGGDDGTGELEANIDAFKEYKSAAKDAAKVREVIRKSRLENAIRLRALEDARAQDEEQEMSGLGNERAFTPEMEEELQLRYRLDSRLARLEAENESANEEAGTERVETTTRATELAAQSERQRAITAQMQGEIGKKATRAERVAWLKKRRSEIYRQARDNGKRAEDPNAHFDEELDKKLDAELEEINEYLFREEVSVEREKIANEKAEANGIVRTIFGEKDEGLAAWILKNKRRLPFVYETLFRAKKALGQLGKQKNSQFNIVPDLRAALNLWREFEAAKAKDASLTVDKWLDTTDVDYGQTIGQDGEITAMPEGLNPDAVDVLLKAFEYSRIEGHNALAPIIAETVAEAQIYNASATAFREYSRTFEDKDGLFARAFLDAIKLRNAPQTVETVVASALDGLEAGEAARTERSALVGEMSEPQIKERVKWLESLPRWTAEQRAEISLLYGRLARLEENERALALDAQELQLREQIGAGMAKLAALKEEPPANGRVRSAAQIAAIKAQKAAVYALVLKRHEVVARKGGDVLSEGGRVLFNLADSEEIISEANKALETLKQSEARALQEKVDAEQAKLAALKAEAPANGRVRSKEQIAAIAAQKKAVSAATRERKAGVKSKTVAQAEAKVADFVKAVGDAELEKVRAFLGKKEQKNEGGAETVPAGSNAAVAKLNKELDKAAREAIKRVEQRKADMEARRSFGDASPYYDGFAANVSAKDLAKARAVLTGKPVFGRSEGMFLNLAEEVAWWAETDVSNGTYSPDVDGGFESPVAARFYHYIAGNLIEDAKRKQRAQSRAVSAARRAEAEERNARERYAKNHSDAETGQIDLDLRFHKQAQARLQSAETADDANAFEGLLSRWLPGIKVKLVERIVHGTDRVFGAIYRSKETGRIMRVEIVNGASIETVAHELGGHATWSWAKENDPELYNTLREASRTAPESIVADVITNYPELADKQEGDEFLEEVFAHAVGRLAKGKAEQMNRARAAEKTWLGKIKALFERAWRALFGARNVAETMGAVDTKALAEMNPLDVMGQVAADFIAGKTLGNPVLAARASFESTVRDAAFAKEVAEIEQVRRAYTNPDGTKKKGWMRAPNGKRTKLTERQWLQVRTPSFKKWFGDWEKNARLGKLLNAKTVELTGYTGQYELNRDAAREWIKENLRGEYKIYDTNETVVINSVGVKKVTSHSSGNVAHLKSVASIPQMLANATFIAEASAEKDGAKYDSYRYYVAGVKIDGVDYTARITVGVKGGKMFYDHSLTQFEKKKLVDIANRPANGFIASGDIAVSPSFADVKDKRLLSLLQEENASKVIDDETGEPLVVYHGSREAEFAEFDNTQSVRKGKVDGGNWFSELQTAATYSGVDSVLEFDEDGEPSPALVDATEEDRELGRTERFVSAGNYAVFLNMRNPKVVSLRGANFRGTPWDEIPTGQKEPKRIEDLDEATLRKIAEEWGIEFNEERPDYTMDEIVEEARQELVETDEDGVVIYAPDDVYFNDDGSLNADYAEFTTTRDIAATELGKGNDGIIFDGIEDFGGWGYRGTATVVYVTPSGSPSQIKSATANEGTFDATNPDIRHSRRGYSAESFEARRKQVISAFKKKYPHGKVIEGVFHGTKNFGFSVFEVSDVEDGGYYFTDSGKVGNTYTGLGHRGWKRERVVDNPPFTHSQYVKKLLTNEDALRKEKDGRWRLDRGRGYEYYDGANEIPLDALKQSFEAYFPEENLRSGIYSDVDLFMKKPLFVDAGGASWRSLPEPGSGERTQTEKEIRKVLDACSIEKREGGFVINYRWAGIFTDDYERAFCETGKELVEKFVELGVKKKWAEDYVKPLVSARVKKLSIQSDKSSTRDWAKYAWEHGHDGVVFENILDRGWNKGLDVEDKPHNVYVVRESEQVKLNKPSMEDDYGEAIFADERYDLANADIRYMRVGESGGEVFPLAPRSDTESITNALNKNTIVPFAGNKKTIIAAHPELFKRIGNLAKSSGGRVIDAFAGAGTYTLGLGTLGALPQGSVLNEWASSRYVMHKMLAKNPQGVATAAENLVKRLSGSAELVAFRENLAKLRAGEKVVNYGQPLVDWFTAELRGEHGIKYVEEQGNSEFGDASILENENSAALYIVLQTLTSGSHPVSFIFNKSGKLVIQYAAREMSSGALTTRTVKGKNEFNENILDPAKYTDRIAAAGKIYQDAGLDVRRGDGWALAKTAKKGDVVFVDPAYLGVTAYGGKDNVDASDANNKEIAITRLVDLLDDANAKGVSIVYTNEYTDKSAVGGMSQEEYADVWNEALKRIKGDKVSVNYFDRATHGMGKGREKEARADIVFASGDAAHLLKTGRAEIDRLKARYGFKTDAEAEKYAWEEKKSGLTEEQAEEAEAWADVRYHKESTGGEQAQPSRYQEQRRTLHDATQELRPQNDGGITAEDYREYVSQGAVLLAAKMVQRGTRLNGFNDRQGAGMERVQAFMEKVFPNEPQYVRDDIYATALALAEPILAERVEKANRIISTVDALRAARKSLREARNKTMNTFRSYANAQVDPHLFARAEAWRKRRDELNEKGANNGTRALTKEELRQLGVPELSAAKDAEAWVSALRDALNKKYEGAGFFAQAEKRGILRKTLYATLRQSARAGGNITAILKAQRVLDDMLYNAKGEDDVLAKAKTAAQAIAEGSVRSSVFELRERLYTMLSRFSHIEARKPEKNRKTEGLTEIFANECYNVFVGKRGFGDDFESYVEQMNRQVAGMSPLDPARFAAIQRLEAATLMSPFVQFREKLKEGEKPTIEETAENAAMLSSIVSAVADRLDRGDAELSRRLDKMSAEADAVADALADAMGDSGFDKSGKQSGARKLLDDALIGSFTGAYSWQQQLLDAIRGCKDKEKKARAEREIKRLSKKVYEAEMEKKRREAEGREWLAKELCDRFNNGVFSAKKSTLILARLARTDERFKEFSKNGHALSAAQVLFQIADVRQPELLHAFDELTADELEAELEDPSKKALYRRIQALPAMEAKIREVFGEEEGAKVLGLIDAMGQKFLSEAPDVDATAMDVAGIPLTIRRSDYFPIVRDFKRIMLNRGAESVAYLPAFMTPRVTSRIDIDEDADIFSVFIRRNADCSHFVATGRLHVELSRILANDRFGIAMSKTQGEAMKKQFADHTRQILLPKLEGAPAYGENPAIGFITNLCAYVALGANILVMIRQVTGITAYAFEAGWRGMMRMALGKKDHGGMLQAMKEIANSDGWTNRYGDKGLFSSGVDEMRIQVSMLNEKNASRLPRVIAGWLMAPNKWGDRVPILLLGQAIYRATIADLMSKGHNPNTGSPYTIEEAKVEAMKVVWDWTERTQQTSLVSNMSTWQRSADPVRRMIGQFQSTVSQFLGAEVLATRQFLSNPKGNWQNFIGVLFNNHVVLPAFFWGTTMLWNMAVFGDEPDDDDFWTLLSSMVVGPLSAWFVFGLAFQQNLLDGKYAAAAFPAMSSISRAFRVAHSGGKAASELVMGDSSAAAEDATKAAVQFAKMFAPLRDVMKLSARLSD